MNDLDDLVAIGRGDPEGMLGSIAGLGGQLQKGYDLGRSAAALPLGEGVTAVVICGMGGSGIGGDVIRALSAGRTGFPVVVVKGHELPEFCGRDTLVLAESFSGNTEETLAAYAEAVRRGCRVVAVSAGGRLAALAEADETPHLALPTDVGMPRAALGYLAGAPLGILEAAELIPPAEEDIDRTVALLDAASEELGPHRSTEANPAKALAAWVGDRVSVIWGSSGVAEVAAVRWKTQFNENAKRPAFHSVLPELDHNEIEGWREGAGAGFAVILLRHPGESGRMGRRIDATLEAIAPSGLDVRQVHARGRTPLEWLFSLIMTGDFATVYTAILHGIDPTPVPVLTGLKDRLRG